MFHAVELWTWHFMVLCQWLVRPTSLCSSEVARLASSRHSRTNLEVLSFCWGIQVWGCLMWCLEAQWSELNRKRWARGAGLVSGVGPLGLWGLPCATLQALSRFALWPCHTLKDVVELVANNLKPSFKGCGPSAGAGVYLQLARYPLQLWSQIWEVMLGHLLHPQVQHGFLLEHGSKPYDRTVLKILELQHL